MSFKIQQVESEYQGLLVQEKSKTEKAEKKIARIENEKN